MTIDTALRVATMTDAELGKWCLQNPQSPMLARKEALTTLAEAHAQVVAERDALQRRMGEIHALASHAEQYHGDPLGVFTRTMELSRPTTGDAPIKEGEWPSQVKR